MGLTARRTPIDKNGMQSVIPNEQANPSQRAAPMRSSRIGLRAKGFAAAMVDGSSCAVEDRAAVLSAMDSSSWLIVSVRIVRRAMPPKMRRLLPLYLKLACHLGMLTEEVRLGSDSSKSRGRGEQPPTVRERESYRRKQAG